MKTLLALVLFSVTLSPPFGNAEARATSSGPDGMVLEVLVEIEQSALVVLVRGIGRFDDELAPVALSELSPGRWGGIVELPVVEDLLLGFELIRPDGGSAIVSELHRLSELGVDPAVFAAAQPTTTAAVSSGSAVEPNDAGPSTAPIWLAVAAGAAALALLLVWWLGGQRDDEGADEGADATVGEAEQAHDGDEEPPEPGGVT